MVCARSHASSSTRSALFTSTQHLFTAMLLRRTIHKLNSGDTALAKAFGVSEAITPLIALKLLDAAGHAATLPPERAAFRHARLAEEESPVVLRRAHERTVELRAKVSAIEKRFAIPLDRPAPELREHAICLRNTKFPFSLWRSDVRSARLRYREINLTSKSPKRGEMAADFEAVAECNEIATGL